MMPAVQPPPCARNRVETGDSESMDESCATKYESKSGIEPGCTSDEANVAHDRVERDSIKAEQVQELAVALETEWTPEGILEQHEITRMAVLLWHLARAK